MTTATHINVDSVTLTQNELAQFLVKVAQYRPVFIWGQPGIGKSAIVSTFSEKIGLDCVQLLGSQLSPEDIIGIPQMMDGTFRFCPPRIIARHEPYCLFLDEFNACSIEVQKVFYTLIHDRRIGEYVMPQGSVVVAAGNRASDHAIVNHLSSALINRMVHVHLKSNPQDWIDWSKENYLHPLVIEYLEKNPHHMLCNPPADEQPFSTPRSWHILSDSLSEIEYDCPENIIFALCAGSISIEHASAFVQFIRGKLKECSLPLLLKGEISWPKESQKALHLRYLAFSLRKFLQKNLSSDINDLKADALEILEPSKALLKQLDQQFPDLTSEVLKSANDGGLPLWFHDYLINDGHKKRLFGLRG